VVVVVVVEVVVVEVAEVVAGAPRQEENQEKNKEIAHHLLIYIFLPFLLFCIPLHTSILHHLKQNNILYILEYIIYNIMNHSALFFEGFKVGKGTKDSQEAPGSGGASGAATGAATGAVAGSIGGAVLSGGSAAAMSNSGSNNVEKCPLTDDTLYCQVSRTAGITGMVVYILFIVIFVLTFFYFMFYLFFRSGGSNVVSKVTKRRR
jgi:predicted permease